MAGKLQARLQYSQIDDVVEFGAQSYVVDVVKSCDEIHDALSDAYFSYPIDEAVS